MRIALVDPSSATRSLVASLLEARGHEVVAFADEHTALRRIEADPLIEALITGDELKSMSGLELCWEARLLATCRRPIYVLFMSAEGGQRNLIEAWIPAPTTLSASRLWPRNSMQDCGPPSASARCNAS
jgi:two-component system cell cycle response regulator